MRRGRPIPTWLLAVLLAIVLANVVREIVTGPEGGDWVWLGISVGATVLVAMDIAERRRAR